MCSKCYFGNPLQQFSQNRRHCFKWSLIVHVGCINENNGQNWILGYLKYIILFVNRQYDFAYLQSTNPKIAASVCCGTLINNISNNTQCPSIPRERSGYTYPMVRRTNMADANERDFRLGFLLAFISIYSEQNLEIMLLII